MTTAEQKIRQVLVAFMAPGTAMETTVGQLVEIVEEQEKKVHMAHAPVSKKFEDNPAPPRVHCGEGQVELMQLREENERLMLDAERYFDIGFKKGLRAGAEEASFKCPHGVMPGVSCAQCAIDARDLEALRSINKRDDSYEFIGVHLPSGRRVANEMPREMLLEVVYMLSQQVKDG